MNDERRVLSRTVRFASGVSLTLTVGADHFKAEWDPEVPKSLTPFEMVLYRETRNALIADFAREHGIKVAVVEL